MTNRLCSPSHTANRFYTSSPTGRFQPLFNVPHFPALFLFQKYLLTKKEGCFPLQRDLACHLSIQRTQHIYVAEHKGRWAPNFFSSLMRCTWIPQFFQAHHSTLLKVICIASRWFKNKEQVSQPLKRRQIANGKSINLALAFCAQTKAAAR